MKKATSTQESDELRPEYDFAQMSGGVRGKYAKRYAAGTNLVLLAPDVAEAFPRDEDVNEALRMLLRVARRHAPRRPASRPARKAKPGVAAAHDKTH